MTGMAVRDWAEGAARGWEAVVNWAWEAEAMGLGAVMQAAASEAEVTGEGTVADWEETTDYCGSFLRAGTGPSSPPWPPR
jgi:hypothetical protein